MAEHGEPDSSADEVKIYSSDPGHRLDASEARAAGGPARALGSRARERLARLEACGRGYVGDKPWAMLGVAALAGAVVGLLASRRGRRHS